MSSQESGSTALLHLERVSVELGGRLVIQDLDLELQRDRTTVLIGPSGCGKSTILRLAVGLERPTAGRVHFDGQVLDGTRVISARRRMGYVIQEGGLFPHLTAGDNVSLLARHLGWELERTQERVRELCTLVRLAEELLTRYPAQLSGGQRQRVGLMRALMLDPELLLLDEPLAALDPMVRAELQEDLRCAIQDRGKACVLVTHDMSEAAFFADDVVLLRAGRIVQRGAARDLADNPAEDFVAEFVKAQRSPMELWG